MSYPSDKPFWDSEEEIGRIQKSDKGDVIVLKKVTKRGKEFLDIRSMYVDKTTGQLAYGKGIAIPDDLVDEIAEMMLESGCTRYAGEDEV